MISLLPSIAVVDPALCTETAASHWATWSWKLYNALIEPHLVLPLIISLILLPWCLRFVRRKWLWSGGGVLLLLIYLATGSSLTVFLGNRVLTSFLPPDPGTPAEAIVVLGRGSELRSERVETAMQLWQIDRAPFIFASGHGDANEIVNLLVEKGVPQAAIDGEPCSRTTEENARFTAAILQPQGMRRILLVTDPPHMLRSFLTFRSLGFEVIPHLNPLPAQLKPRKASFLLLREYTGLASYGLKGRFFQRSLPAETPVYAQVKQ